MPAADTSAAAADGQALRAEAVQAQTLIAEGARIGTTPAAESAASATPSGAATTESPFDTAFHAVVSALPLGDSGVATTSSASSTVHAGGSEAAVATVITADQHSATEVAQAGSPTAGTQFTI